MMSTIRSGGIVPLISSGDPEVLWRAAVAVAKAGLGVIEVALRAPHALVAFAALADRVDSERLNIELGVGTVLDADTAGAAIDAGAKFVFSPVLGPGVGERCRTAGVAWLPGCASPTEVHMALDAGCTGVKLFPADTIGGPQLLRALRSVFGRFPAIPSGGVVPTPEVLSEWFAAGADAVGVGSWLFPNVDAESWDEVAHRLDSAVAAVVQARADSRS